MRFLLFIFFCFSCLAYQAQEHLSPVLFSKAQNQGVKLIQRGVSVTSFEIDTLNLPFIDDFSSNKIKSYNGDTSNVNYSVNLSYDFSFGGKFPSSFNTLPAGEESFSLIWNHIEDRFDTIAQTPVEIISFNKNIYPAIVRDTMYYWNAFTIRIDSTGTSDTTFLTFNDTTWINDFNEFIIIEDDESLWMDETSLSVYVNNTYPINPPSLGVATFDAINEFGALYSNASTFKFNADYLTSKPIDLSTFSDADSVMLSFYYQPQGLGEFPSEDDSLILEFQAPGEGWTWQWSDNGSSYLDFISEHGTSFKQVHLTISDSVWFQKGFQFRFHNIASLAGNIEPSWSSNADHWNIDYVVLDSERSSNNLSPEDVSFTENPKSIFNDFTQVPLKHYLNRNEEILKDSLYNLAVNNSSSSSPKNVTYDLDISEEGNSLFNSGNYTINMNDGEFFNFFGELDGLGLTTAESDSTSFTVTHSLSTDANDLKTNDTLIYQQILKQSYAYDDGSSEAGYGISSNGGKVALAFNTIQDEYDTLQAIQIYFNQTLNDANVRSFKLSVWQGNGVEPSQLLYQSDDIQPIYSSHLNNYVTYVLDTNILVGGEFYIGWEQNHEDLLNIGFDMNANIENRLMYSIAATGGDWRYSSFDGALMMRPILGNPYVAPQSIRTHNTLKNQFILYPNPTNSLLQITSDQPYNFQIYNSVGQLLKSGEANIQHQIDVSSWSKGIYFFQIISNGHTNTQRFIVK